MKKIKLLIIAVIMALTVIMTPQSAKAICPTGDPIPCILQAGGQVVQDAANWIENVFNNIKQTILQYLEDANAWLSKYLNFGAGTKPDSSQSGTATAASAPTKVPNVASLSSRRSYSYKVQTRNSAGEIVETNAGTVKGKIEDQVEAKKKEQMTIKGDLAGIQEEKLRKEYISQQDSIDALAKALVIKKEILDGFEEVNEVLEDAISRLPYPVPSPTTTTSPQETQTPETKASPNMLDELKMNLKLRLIWDGLLTTQQQLLAIRLRTHSLHVQEQLGDVSEDQELVIIKTEDHQSEGPNHNPEAVFPKEGK